MINIKTPDFEEGRYVFKEVNVLTCSIGCGLW